jgi:hypothetical protein
MRSIIRRLGETLSPVSIVALVIGLNVYWVGILGAFSAHFEQVAGAPLLDVQNVSAIMSASDAQRLIATYNNEAQTLYWQFFVMDNIMPPLVFSSFALLWVMLLRQRSRLWIDQFFNSPLLFVPLLYFVR